jgi:thiosulfate reductase cytochrome b subunit
VIAKHLRLAPQDADDAGSYNVLQRVTYLVVVFVLFPLVIVSGLAMSPAFNSVVPWCVNALGGRQSARTVHFLVSVSLVLFLAVHVLMVVLSGFATRMREMITGVAGRREEHA